MMGGKLTICNHVTGPGIASWFNRNPAKSRLNSMTSTPSRFATPGFRTQMPMKRQIIAAARLKSTMKRMNLKNSPHCGIRPVMG